MAFWIGFTLIAEGIELYNAPDSEPARLVECYDSFDDSGAIYNCDFFVYSNNEYTTKYYKRQDWNQMKTGIGTDYMINTNRHRIAFAFVLGTLVLMLAGVLAWIAWMCWEDDRLLRRDY